MGYGPLMNAYSLFQSTEKRFLPNHNQNNQRQSMP